MLPRPPRITAHSKITDKANSNWLGKMEPMYAPNVAPAIPDRDAPIPKADSLVVTRLMPIADAAISSSLIAIHVAKLARKRDVAGILLDQNLKFFGGFKGESVIAVPIDEIATSLAVVGIRCYCGDQLLEIRIVDRRRGRRNRCAGW